MAKRGQWAFSPKKVVKVKVTDLVKSKMEKRQSKLLKTS